MSSFLWKGWSSLTGTPPPSPPHPALHLRTTIQTTLEQTEIQADHTPSPQPATLPPSTLTSHQAPDTVIHIPPSLIHSLYSLRPSGSHMLAPVLLPDPSLLAVPPVAGSHLYAAFAEPLEFPTLPHQIPIDDLEELLLDSTTFLITVPYSLPDPAESDLVLSHPSSLLDVNAQTPAVLILRDSFRNPAVLPPTLPLDFDIFQRIDNTLVQVSSPLLDIAPSTTSSDAPANHVPLTITTPTAGEFIIHAALSSTPLTTPPLTLTVRPNSLSPPDCVFTLLSPHPLQAGSLISIGVLLVDAMGNRYTPHTEYPDIARKAGAQVDLIATINDKRHAAVPGPPGRDSDMFVFHLRSQTAGVLRLHARIANTPVTLPANIEILNILPSVATPATTTITGLGSSVALAGGMADFEVHVHDAYRNQAPYPDLNSLTLAFTPPLKVSMVADLDALVVPEKGSVVATLVPSTTAAWSFVVNFIVVDAGEYSLDIVHASNPSLSLLPGPLTLQVAVSPSQLRFASSFMTRSLSRSRSLSPTRSARTSTSPGGLAAPSSVGDDFPLELNIDSSGLNTLGPIQAGQSLSLRLPFVDAFGNHLISSQMDPSWVLRDVSVLLLDGKQMWAPMDSVTGAVDSHTGLLHLGFQAVATGTHEAMLECVFVSGKVFRAPFSLSVVPGEVHLPSSRVWVESSSQRVCYELVDSYGNGVPCASLDSVDHVHLSTVTGVDWSPWTPDGSISNVGWKQYRLHRPDDALEVRVMWDGTEFPGSPVVLAPESRSLDPQSSSTWLDVPSSSSSLDGSSNGLIVAAGEQVQVFVRGIDGHGNDTDPVTTGGPVSIQARLQQQGSADTMSAVLSEGSVFGLGFATLSLEVAGPWEIEVTGPDGAPIANSPLSVVVAPGPVTSLSWITNSVLYDQAIVGAGVACTVELSFQDAFGNAVTNPDGFVLDGTLIHVQEEAEVGDIQASLDETSGRVALSFATGVVGDYVLVVRLGGEKDGSETPYTLSFSIVPGKPDAGAFRRMGRAPPSTLVAGSEYTFSFLACDASGNPLDGLLHPSARNALQLDFTNADTEDDLEGAAVTPVSGEGPGVYSVTATPVLAGTYDVGILLSSGLSVPGLGGPLVVVPGPMEAGQTRVVRTSAAADATTGSVVLEAGAIFQAELQMSDRFGNAVEAKSAKVSLVLTDSAGKATRAASTGAAPKPTDPLVMVCAAAITQAGQYVFQIKDGGTGEAYQGASWTLEVVPQASPEWGLTALVESPAFPDGRALGEPAGEPAPIETYLGDELAFIFELHDAYQNPMLGYSCSETALRNFVDIQTGDAVVVELVVEDGILTLVIKFETHGKKRISLVAMKTKTVLAVETCLVVVDWVKIMSSVRMLLSDSAVTAQLQCVDMIYTLLEDYPEETQVAEMYRMLTKAYDNLAIWSFGAAQMVERLQARGMEMELLVQCATMLNEQAAKFGKSRLQTVLYILDKYLGIQLNFETVTEAEAKKLCTKLKRLTIKVHPDKIHNLGIKDESLMSAALDRVMYTLNSLKKTIERGTFAGR